MTIEDLIKEASALPVDERARLIDSLLRTLNPGNPELDRAWGEEASRRLEEVRSGQVETVPADEVFAKARNLVPR